MLCSGGAPLGAYHSFVGVSLDIGDRKSMEDEFMVNTGGDLSYYGVYDGHAGSLASLFVREHLANRFLAETSSFTLCTREKLERAMTQSHVSVDKDYFRAEQDARKEGSHSSYSGSTSISLVLHPREGWGFVANAGDCRAVLFHKGKIVSLSSDHRINRSGVTNSETERILSLGGWVEEGLLCGQLEPTRGFGDHDFKQLKKTKFPSGSFKSDLVIPIPEYEWFSLTQEPEDIIASTSCENEITVGIPADHYSFILLASDGVWDTISNCNVLQCVSKHVKEGKGGLSADSLQNAANDLVNQVRLATRKQKISMDNTTAILIGFAPCEDPGQFGNKEISSCLSCFLPTTTEHTNTIIHSKAAVTAQSKTKRSQRNQKRKKRQKTKNKK